VKITNYEVAHYAVFFSLLSLSLLGSVFSNILSLCSSLPYIRDQILYPYKIPGRLLGIAGSIILTIYLKEINY
jgi:hypothetical protein